VKFLRVIELEIKVSGEPFIGASKPKGGRNPIASIGGMIGGWL
jgi:hypothetical protein